MPVLGGQLGGRRIGGGGHKVGGGGHKLGGGAPCPPARRRRAVAQPEVLVGQRAAVAAALGRRRGGAAGAAALADELAARCALARPVPLRRGGGFGRRRRGGGFGRRIGDGCSRGIGGGAGLPWRIRRPRGWLRLERLRLERRGGRCTLRQRRRRARRRVRVWRRRLGGGRLAGEGRAGGRVGCRSRAPRSLRALRQLLAPLRDPPSPLFLGDRLLPVPAAESLGVGDCWEMVRSCGLAPPVQRSGRRRGRRANASKVAAGVRAPPPM